MTHDLDGWTGGRTNGITLKGPRGPKKWFFFIDGGGVDSIAVSVFVYWLSLSNTESEANPNNNLMMRRACLSREVWRISYFSYLYLFLWNNSLAIFLAFWGAKTCFTIGGGDIWTIWSLLVGFTLWKIIFFSAKKWTEKNRDFKKVEGVGGDFTKKSFFI